MRFRVAGAIALAALLSVAGCNGDEQEQDVQQVQHGPAPMPADAPVDGAHPVPDSGAAHPTTPDTVAPPTTTH